MIKYKGIEFLTVDQLIEYQEKAEGLVKPVKLTVTDRTQLGDPPPFYPKQHDPWIHKGPPMPSISPILLDPGIRINDWKPSLAPTSETNILALTNNTKAAKLDSSIDTKLYKASHD